MLIMDLVLLFALAIIFYLQVEREILSMKTDKTGTFDSINTLNSAATD